MPSNQVSCIRCGLWYNVGWNEKGGCPACQGILSYPIGFYSTAAYKEERNKKMRDKYELNVKSLIPEKMTQDDFDEIVKDLCTTNWLDEQGHEEVKQLVKYVLYIDKNMKLKDSIKE